LEKVLWIIAEQKIVKDYAFAAAKVVQKCRVGKRNNVDRYLQAILETQFNKGELYMEMRKQGGEGQGTARSASKSRQQTGEETPGSMNQGTTQNQGMTGTQGTTGNQGASQNQQNQQTSPNQANIGQQRTGQQSGGEQDLLQHAKQATGNIVNKVQQQAGSQLTRQKETAATELSQVANAVRRLRENLPQQELGPIARVVGDYGEKAADSLERLSTYVRDKEPKQLLDDVQNFGRRQPALLLGGAFLLGFAGARLIRSSMSAAYEQRSAMDVQRTTFKPEHVSAPRPSAPPTV
jgi:hypothetical protein